MKHILLTVLAWAAILPSAHASSKIQFECSASGVPGTIQITTAENGRAQVIIDNQPYNVTVKERNALNMAGMEYTSIDESLNIQIYSRGARWDGRILIIFKQGDISCDYK